MRRFKPIMRHSLNSDTKSIKPPVQPFAQQLSRKTFEPKNGPPLTESPKMEKAKVKKELRPIMSTKAEAIKLAKIKEHNQLMDEFNKFLNNI